MTEFTKEFIESQLEKWHSSTNDEWLTECWNNYGLALEEIQRLQARVQELEQERRWIPVSERLPEKNGFYYLHIHSDDGRSYERVGIFFIDGYFDVLCDKVTHWQPLPQPPKEEE